MESFLNTVVVVFLAIVFLAYKLGLFKRSYKRKFYQNRRDNLRQVYPDKQDSESAGRPDLSDPAVALRYVQVSQYTLRPLMSKKVYSLFKLDERFFKDMNQGHLVIPEMCMGAALNCTDKEGFSSINSKRLDIGVIDRTGNLILAIEYNGGGHYQANAAGRDAVKRLALNKAQVPLIEVIPDDSNDRILEKLKSVMPTAVAKGSE